MILVTHAVSALADRDADLLVALNGTDRAFLSYVAVAEFRFGLLGSKEGELGISFLAALTAAMPTPSPYSPQCAASQFSPVPFSTRMGTP
mgnify:CR=1 FL=1|jgi:hypothetical protein